MSITRSLVFATALLALVISGCSQPEDLTASTLESQFGSENADIGFDVSVMPNGRIFVLAEEEMSDHDEYDPWFSKELEQLYLTVYDGNGNPLASAGNVVESITCEYAYGNCGGDWLRPLGLYADAKGFRYALYVTQFSEYEYDIDPDRPYVDYFVEKLDSSGNRFTYIVGQGSAYQAGSVVSAAVDSNGNIYVAKVQYAHDHTTGTGTYTNIVAKYSTTGALQWQRTSPVGIPKDITVSSSDSVYIVGTGGVARYNGSGSLTWTKPGNFEEVIVSGSSIYTRYRKDIRKFDGTGKQLWLRSQTGLNTIVFQDMVGDGSGNVYLSGKYEASSGNMNAMVRKLNTSGSVLWTKTYGTPAYDDARGIATLSGSEIYVTGETQGSLAHPNRGGNHNRDAYVRKLNSSGSPIWTR